MESFCALTIIDFQLFFKRTEFHLKKNWTNALKYELQCHTSTENTLMVWLELVDYYGGIYFVELDENYEELKS